MDEKSVHRKDDVTAICMEIIAKKMFVVFRLYYATGICRYHIYLRKKKNGEVEK